MRRFAQTLCAAGALAALGACATIEPRYPAQTQAAKAPPGGGPYKVGKPYQVSGVWYVPREQPDYDEVGVGSWYGPQFNLKPTANGETFDMDALSAAHTTLPLPSMVEVTNLENGRRLVVRVNDRGPFVGDRIIDLSRAAARELGYERAGVAKLRVRYVGRAPTGNDPPVRERGMQYAAKVLPKLPKPRFSLPVDAGDVLKAAGAIPIPPPAVVAVALPPLPPVAPLITEALPSLAAAPKPAETMTAELEPPKVEFEPPELKVEVPEVSLPLRVQAGAFMNEGNALQAVRALAEAGPAEIETIKRNGVTLYRVVLPAPGDEAAAFALRDKVAAIGFADARVVSPF